MPRLRFEVRLECSETRHRPTGHPCGEQRKSYITVLTSWENVLEYLREKQRESEICNVTIRPI